MRNNDVTCANLDVQYGCNFYSHRNRFDISLSYMYIKISGLWVWIPLTGLTSPHVCAWIQHGLVAIPAETYLVPGDTRTRGEHKFCPPNLRKDVYKYSFFPRTIGDWNRLPPHVACATSLEGFKNQLDTLTGYQLGVQTM